MAEFVVWIETNCSLATAVYDVASKQEALELHGKYFPEGKVLGVTEGEVPDGVANSLGNDLYYEGWGTYG